MEKICFKCNKIKSLNDFYIHSKMKDGHLGKCKECAKKDAHELWIKDLEQNREKERDRFQRRKKNEKNFYKKRNEYDKKWRTPDKTKASNEVQRKLINPRICSLCGSIRSIEGHHMDYSKPLEVIWCCSVCHHKFRKQSI